MALLALWAQGAGERNDDNGVTEVRISTESKNAEIKNAANCCNWCPASAIMENRNGALMQTQKLNNPKNRQCLPTSLKKMKALFREASSCGGGIRNPST